MLIAKCKSIAYFISELEVSDNQNVESTPVPACYPKTNRAT